MKIVSKNRLQKPVIPAVLKRESTFETWMPDYNLGHDEKKLFSCPFFRKRGCPTEDLGHDEKEYQESIFRELQY
jgi:hypothetical protein